VQEITNGKIKKLGYNFEFVQFF